ncbi:hypothetical protein [uncultured Friedmanniella sp.]|uniref:hypothetical protein n=1 Tax=uncultured Friedmanniella sp. TaxID=335381 RepID=UPI0035C9F8AD
MTRTRLNPLAAGLVAAYPLITAFAWRDLRRRPADQIRGSKTLWRVLTVLNAGNSLLYLLVGVRRS